MAQHVAFVFPGQGSQSVGMLQALTETHGDVVKQLADQAASALGYDLLNIINQGPAEELNKTEITQPALLMTSYALWLVCQQHTDLRPTILAGHSLGEYSALVCAGAIDFVDAIKLVALRGSLMQQAVPAGKGAMAAIVGLDDAAVSEVCEQASSEGVVVPANYNSIGQVVISGEKTAVEKAATLAKEAGAKLAKVLPVSVPSHSPLMQPAADELAKAISNININTPSIPVIHNVSVNSAEHPDDIRQQLVEQLHKPVRWVETIQLLQQEGFNVIVECGAAKVLTGLSKRIDRSLQSIAYNDASALPTLTEL